jgi:hypothetical protein
MGAAAAAGCDKLTALLPPALHSPGLGIEQLVAESTRKQGRGLLPVVDEPLNGGSAAYGAEFFRWEFATAVAGAGIEVNPFDEPNVTEAKERTRALLETFQREGRLPEEPPADAADLRRLLGSIRDRDYFAVLTFLPPEADTLDAINDLRRSVRSQGGNATTCGIGPRYLHSTGQYHKGGPDTGVFLVITGEDETSTPIPGAPYSFSILKRGQALGDFQSLAARRRRVARVHVTERQRGPALERLFAQALS